MVQLQVFQVATQTNKLESLPSDLKAYAKELIDKKFPEDVEPEVVKPKDAFVDPSNGSLHSPHCVCDRCVMLGNPGFRDIKYQGAVVDPYVNYGEGSIDMIKITLDYRGVFTGRIERITFCYPEGSYTRRVKEEIHEFKYELERKYNEPFQMQTA